MANSPISILHDYQGHRLEIINDNGVYRLATQISGPVQIGSTFIGKPIVIGGLDTVGFVRTFAVSSDGYLKIIGTGLPGVPANEVITIQGITNGIPLPITGNISINGTPTVSISDTVTISQLVAGNLNATIVGIGSAGSPSGGVLSIQGVSGGTNVPVSVISMPSSMATESTLSTLLTENTFTGRINTLGQKTMSGSVPVVLASNQSTIPVSIVDGGLSGVQKSLYDIGNTEIYIGKAPQGTDSSVAMWLIKKITLDTNGIPTNILYSNDTAIWDNRLTEIYS